MEDDLFALHDAIEETHWWFVGRRCILIELVHALAVPGQGKRVVDIGCGTGGNIGALENDYECAGFDASADGLRRAAARFRRVTFTPMVRPDDAHAALAAADVVLLCDVLEHIEGDRTFLVELIAQMKPGAALIITVPARMALWTRHDEVFGHFRRYELDTLPATWAGCPVDVRLLSFLNARLYLVIRAFRWVRGLFPSGSGAAATDFRRHDPVSNTLLTHAFAGEATRLRAAMERRSRPYGNGASLCAVLVRTAAGATA